MAVAAAQDGSPHQQPSLLHLIALVDNVPIDFETNCTPYYRLQLAPDPRTHGYIHPNTVNSMPWPASFTINHDTRQVTLSPPSPKTSLSLSAHANAAFQAAIDAAIDGNMFPMLNGMHSEHFLLMGAREFVQIERFAASLFGIATRGAHLTCYVRAPDGLKIWVAKRSPKLFTYPGMLDSTVAGGVKADNSPLDCILAEATEEASLPADLVARLVRSVGVLTLANRNPRTELHHSEVLYVYDMELEEDIVPTPQDGEVEEFVLMDCAELRHRMLNGEFKPNVCPIMIDFLVRHGEITPEGERHYVEICNRLRRRLPVPTVPDQY
ncbi:NUDIX domain protein [Metarhizium robertsii]|uniref:NUDIX hydrolase domain protein n=2 Tax=Metarhizium robertsii TaxID=568076 RepID=E9EZF8_METRA|nr:NUDIX hydrolase domain protein [Metarhizium robertsii ARSEF 23]EFY99349.1 NUDIX hydrolase domain protein [Metarhizium robertsii ARSEF 23]EXV04619.1 NUDIX domain protein [Metarhizium robertsii]